MRPFVDPSASRTKALAITGEKLAVAVIDGFRLVEREESCVVRRCDRLEIVDGVVPGFRECGEVQITVATPNRSRNASNNRLARTGVSDELDHNALDAQKRTDRADERQSDRQHQASVSTGENGKLLPLLQAPFFVKLSSVLLCLVGQAHLERPIAEDVAVRKHERSAMPARPRGHAERHRALQRRLDERLKLCCAAPDTSGKRSARIVARGSVK